MTRLVSLIEKVLTLKGKMARLKYVILSIELKACKYGGIEWDLFLL